MQMLKSVNTPMQKNNSATCWAMMMMDFWGVKKKVKKVFVSYLWVTKLIINEQDVAVRTFKKIEYTPSKLHENKERAWRSNQRHYPKV